MQQNSIVAGPSLGQLTGRQIDQDTTLSDVFPPIDNSHMQSVTTSFRPAASPSSFLTTTAAAAAAAAANGGYLNDGANGVSHSAV